MSLAAEEQPARSGGVREVFDLAWPLVLTNGCWTVQIFIDRVFLGRHSQAQMAATLPAIVFFWALLNFFNHTAGYVATFIAQYSGAGRAQRIGPVVGQALYFCLIGAVFFAGLIPFVPTIFAWIGHETALQEHEAVFFRILCFGAFSEMVKATTFSFFSGRGDSRTVLGISIITLIVNAALCYAWVFGKFGFPAWGIAGAGWSTVVASSLGAIIGIALMMRRRHRMTCGMDQVWRFEPGLFRRLMRFGLPNGFYVAAETAAFSAFIFIIGRMGQSELAASNMTFALNTIAFLPTLGIGQAVEVLVGRHLGENCPDVAENRTWIGFVFATTIMIVFAVLYVAIPDLMLAPFATETNQHVIGMTRVLLRFVAFYSLLDSANVIFAFAIRGAGDTKFVSKVMSCVPWLGMVLPTWLCLRFGWGVNWAWACATFYVCILAFIFYFRFRFGPWRGMRVIEPARAGAEHQ